MASVGHVALGMAAARVVASPRRPLTNNPSWGSLCAWSLLSILPDADFIGVAFGYRYGSSSPLGHRGATHSVAFAILIGIAAMILARRRHKPVVLLATAAFLVVLSHALLDCMTQYGIGCALLWPFDSTRYMFAWRIVPTLERFDDLWTVEAWSVALREALRFAPFFFFAFWPATPSRERLEGQLRSDR